MTPSTSSDSHDLDQLPEWEEEERDDKEEREAQEQEQEEVKENGLTTKREEEDEPYYARPKSLKTVDMADKEKTDGELD